MLQHSELNLITEKKGRREFTFTEANAVRETLTRLSRYIHPKHSLMYIYFCEGNTCNTLKWIRDLFLFWQYECRKAQAESRARVHGKFARESVEIPKFATVHQLEDGGENLLVKMQKKGDFFLSNFQGSFRCGGENKWRKQFSLLSIFSTLSSSSKSDPLYKKSWNIENPIDDYSVSFRLMNCRTKGACTAFCKVLLNARRPSCGSNPFSWFRKQENLMQLFSLLQLLKVSELTGLSDMGQTECNHVQKKNK